jgi:hypothetical protein
MKFISYFGILPFLAVFCLGIYGYIVNIVSLVSGGEHVGMTIARGIGIIVAPVGAVLGFF